MAFSVISPDGRWLAFSQGSEVKRIEVDGGPVLSVLDEGSNPHWGVEDLIASHADDNPEPLAGLLQLGNAAVQCSQILLGVGIGLCNDRMHCRDL